MLSKPTSCEGCPLLAARSVGFAPSIGPAGAPIAIVGEALGKTEAAEGEPFVGQAGVYLNRAFSLLGMNRADFRIGNVVHCQPPKDWLVGAPWEVGAISHCHTNRVLNLYGYAPTVYLTTGVTATRTVLSEVLGMEYRGSINDWHSYVLSRDGKPPFVVPTFHPAFILVRQPSLLGALLFALRRAAEVASFGFTRQPVSLVVDPDVVWFISWVEELEKNPAAWVAVDIENPVTPGEEEGEIAPGIREITRINFSMNPDEGITVPWDPRYIPFIKRVLASPNPKVMFNERYDNWVLKAHNIPVNGAILDCMWAWHFLQSSMPRGLGFVAPFYSDLPPWKHLSSTNIGYYAAMDGVQTLRSMNGVAKDLRSNGQWETFVRHSVQLDSRVLHPMEEVGLKLDRDRLSTLHSELDSLSSSITQEIRTMIPPHLRPLTGGWKNPPKGYPGSEVVAKKVTMLTQVCEECGAVDVTSRHKCQKQLPLKEIV